MPPENPDLDPLLEHSTTKRKGIILNRREIRAVQIEKCGRIRLGVLSVGLFFIIYFCFYIGTWTDEIVLVSIPPDDENLPGPKVEKLKLYKNISLNTTTTTTTTSTQKPISINKNATVPKGYLVYGQGCKMPDINPLSPEAMNLFHKEKYEECTYKKPLTKLIKNYTNGAVYLNLDESQRKKYLTKDSHCCYQDIRRSGEDKNADNNYSLNDCIEFKKTLELPESSEFILVKCKDKNKKDDKTQYINVHASVRQRPDIRDRLDQYEIRDEKRPLSVLMIGIDSISRLNLIRSMPHTAQTLYNTGWFELKGYNKIDDNTFPNLMAILVGVNNTLAYTDCDPKKVGKLETCSFMWNYFKDNGYVTAYGEDEASINTFNYNKFGFIKPPTDYYMRPYCLAAEKSLHAKYKSSLKFCLGYKHYADHIYDYAIDFATVYKNDPSFGLFWTNTFSHNAISDPSSMDMKMKRYIEELEERGILNNSMVVFFSDHGLRFGPIRVLETGWFEERLPFIFIWLPEWFKKENPEIVQALKINRNRLTNPYDLHMTLKHILELSGRVEKLPLAISCPECHSIFKEVSVDRSCEDVSITDHWCTCAAYEKADRKSTIINKAVKFVLENINLDLEQHKNGTKNLCAKLKLSLIEYAREASFRNITEPYDNYLIVFKASPGGGIFESTVKYYLNHKNFVLSGSVSRLNSYDSQSHCMHIDYLKKYCYC